MSELEEALDRLPIRQRFAFFYRIDDAAQTSQVLPNAFVAALAPKVTPWPLLGEKKKDSLLSFKLLQFLWDFVAFWTCVKARTPTAKAGYQYQHVFDLNADKSNDVARTMHSKVSQVSTKD